MTPFENPDFDNHEQILFCSDEQTGLKAIIAIHNTRLGPAAGGCRMYPYSSTMAAVTDALRLSKGMSYKNALAGLPLGGGKSVIIADPSSPGKEARLRAFAKHVQSLGGRYWTAIDVGVGSNDIAVMGQTTEFVFSGINESRGINDTAMATAFGGFTAIKAAVLHKFGKDDLTGIRVAIQGVGKTGMDICRQLKECGAHVIVADLNSKAVDHAVRTYNATAVPPDQIYEQDVDVFSPCAMGAIINDTTLPRLKARIICGLANNQLAESRHGIALNQKGILYVPDYVANCGGMLYASDDIFGINDSSIAYERIRNIAGTLQEIFRKSDLENRSTAEIADEMALSIIHKGQRKPEEKLSRERVPEAIS